MHVHTHYGVGPHPFSIPKKPSSACADKEILTSGGLNLNLFTFSSVQFIHSVVSDSLQPHGLQLARLPCASPTSLSILFKLMSIKLVMPSNHLILCYPFLLLPSIFQPFNPSTPASGSFPMSQFLASGGQSIGASASASVLLMDIQD